jgi:hydroxyacylglutathione hydrolase
MNLVALPAFSDNLIWMLHDGSQALVVDPGDSAPVLAALTEWQLVLSGILVTHHHGDHTGGIEALRPVLQGPVWGPARESIPQPYTPLSAGQSLEWQGLRFEVLDVPGHTAGHIAFWAQPAGQAPVLFCGDTLFSGGCGRLFEGTPAQMHHSLMQLAALPAESRVCCAHEYTLSNLRFALAVEPDNQDLLRYVDHCTAVRERGEFTLPSSIGLERLINPFLRCALPGPRQAALQQGAGSAAEVDVFAALRLWKNNFR